MIAWLFALFSVAGFAQETAPPKYPIVESFSGDVKLRTAREDQLRVVKPHELLREHAEIVSGRTGILRLRLSPTTDVELRPGTRVELPGISWEKGEVPELRLQNGRLRWITSKPDLTVLKSPLFEVTPPAGDYLFEFDQPGARAEVQVLKGEIHFGALNAEDAVTVKENQKASFQGLLQDGEIAYDVLLKGRKIPRGTLSPVSALTSEDLKPFREAQDAAVREKREKEREAHAKEREIAKSGTICRSPSARFNECAWTCQGFKSPKGKGKGKGRASKACPTDQTGVSCVRRRCDANGAWADPFTLAPDEGAQRCSSAAVVSPCDY